MYKITRITLHIRIMAEYIRMYIHTYAVLTHQQHAGNMDYSVFVFNTYMGLHPPRPLL